MYATLREKIAAEKAERTVRYAEYQRIIDEATREAHAAATAVQPRPMTILDASGNPIEVVQDGLCGFAWITIRPGTSSFARWVAENAGFRKAYYGGKELWVSEYNQSVERKEAFAEAFANVLNRYSHITGATATFSSRLD